MERELAEFHLNDDVDENPRKRKRRIPDYLRDEIVDSTLGHSHTLSPEIERQRLFKAIIDTVLWEMRDRFSETNSHLLSAMSCILPAIERTSRAPSSRSQVLSCKRSFASFIACRTCFTVSAMKTNSFFRIQDSNPVASTLMLTSLLESQFSSTFAISA